MKKTLLPVLVSAMLLAGCGASAPASADCAVGSAEKCASGSPMESAPVTTYASPFDGSAPEESPETMEIPWENGHYITLERSNHTVLEGETPILYEYRCHPEFTASDPELETWVDSVLEGIHRDYTTRSDNLTHYASENRKETGDSDFYAYSNYQDIGVTRHDDSLICLIVLNSVYSGGVHPNSVQTAWNLDLVNHRVLTLEDILEPGTEEALAELVCRRVEQRLAGLGEGALYENYRQIISDAFIPGAMTPYWYFNDRGLVVFFNQYTLGPYAAGIIKAELLYEELEGILSGEFAEDVNGVTWGEILVHSGTEGLRRYPVPVEPGDREIPVGTGGEVYRLRLSEILLLEGTVIGQKTLFSANRLTARETVVLQGDFSDPQRRFAAEYQTASGETGITYIRPDGLMTETP